ncbi:MAG: hypothetical protein ACKO7D_08860 [Bacteroidota bacterium]
MKKFFFCLSILFILSACGGSNQKTIEESFTSFVQTNNKVVTFGSVNVKEILNKADYSKIPKFGGIIATQLTSFSGSINLDKPLYFAAEGPFDTEGMPAALYVFVESKNQDSVTKKMKSLGYEMIEEKENKFSFYQDKQMSISVKESLMIGVFKPSTKDFKSIIASSFKMSENEIKEDRIKQMVESKEDIVAGVNLESLFATSNTDLEKLPKEKKEMVKSMMKSSYILNTLSFNAGEMVFKTQNYFSEELKKRIPLKQEAAGNVLKNLGTGEPRLGLLLNLDFAKLNGLIKDLMLEDEIGGFTEGFTTEEMSFSEMYGEVLNGQLGAVVYEETMAEGGLTPQTNVYVGLGKQGKEGFDKLKIPGLSLIERDIFDTHVLFFSSKDFKPSAEPIKVARGCENFGSKPISGFIHLNGIPVEDFDAEGAFKFVEKIDYIYFEYGVDGGLLKLQAIDQKTNILKQSVDQALAQLSEILIKMVL